MEYTNISPFSSLGEDEMHSLKINSPAPQWKELQEIERSPKLATNEVDFYGQGNDSFYFDDEPFALREDLLIQKEIELKERTNKILRDSLPDQIPIGSPGTKSRFAKLTSGAARTVAKATTDLAKTFSDFGSKLKYTVINKDTEQVWNDIVAIFYEQFGPLEVSKLDFILGMILLGLYYKENVQRTCKYVKNRKFSDEARHFYKFAYGAYGWKVLYSRRQGAKRHVRGLAVKARDGVFQANTDVLLHHTGLKKEDVIDMQWISESFSPGHFIALDHSTKNIIVAIRGTSHMHDFLTDLCGRNVPFQSGFAHHGILKCAETKAKYCIPFLEKLRVKYPSYDIKVVGHSLGGGTAALLTMILVTEHPDWPILGYCYASPCVVSKNLAEQYEDKIFSFAYGNDPIARVSLGSMEALKNTIAQLLKQSENNAQRMYHIISAGTVISSYPDFSKKVETFLNVKSAPDITKLDFTVSSAEKLVPPGKLYHLYKPDPSKNMVVLEESNRDFFTEIVISNDMVQHHFPHSYDAAWKSLLQSEDYWEEELRDLRENLV